MKIAKTAGVVASSIGLVVGLSGLAGATSGTIGTTGPWSNNQFTDNSVNSALLTNNNTLPVTTTNAQTAYTGNANVDCNNQGGSAITGAAFNQNSTNVSASINNLSGAGLLGGWGAGDPSFANINLTGPNSNNQVLFNHTNTLTLTNNNSIPVTTTNSQTATSGNANVTGNTFGGSAITGNASNTNNTNVNLNVTN